MIRALLLDLDNTLIDRDLAYRLYVDDLLTRIPHDRDAADNLGAEIVRRDCGGRADREVHCRWLATRLPSVGWSASDFWQDQRANLSRFIRRDPDVCDLLGRLKQQFTLAIVTNGSMANQREKIRRAGLSELVDEVVVSEAIGSEKPAQEIFLQALARLNCRPDEAIMVGDDFENDVLGARSLGIGTIWVQASPIPDRERIPGPRIRSLSELADALALISGGHRQSAP